MQADPSASHTLLGASGDWPGPAAAGTPLTSQTMSRDGLRATGAWSDGMSAGKRAPVPSVMLDQRPHVQGWSGTAWTAKQPPPLARPCVPPHAPEACSGALPKLMPLAGPGASSAQAQASQQAHSGVVGMGGDQARGAAAWAHSLTGAGWPTQPGSGRPVTAGAQASSAPSAAMRSPQRAPNLTGGPGQGVPLTGAQPVHEEDRSRSMAIIPTDVESSQRAVDLSAGLGGVGPPSGSQQVQKERDTVGASPVLQDVMNQGSKTGLRNGLCEVGKTAKRESASHWPAGGDSGHGRSQQYNVSELFEGMEEDSDFSL